MTVSLVTGCSTGIGAAIALRLAREGHTVHASVRTEASGAPLLAAASDLDLSLVLMDVDDGDSVAAGIESVIGQSGRVDVLVNNAGIAGGLGAIEEMPIEAFESVLNTNLLGGVRCIQAVMPGMRERGEGAVVNITSAAGQKVLAGQGAYAASKFAMEAVTEALAAEAMPFGIRVAAVGPGVVATPIFTKPSPVATDPDTPYPGAARMTDYFMAALNAGPAVPEDVADVVWQALTTDAPLLRYPVGTDAQRMAVRRAELSDEAWVGAQTVESDDDWWAFVTDMSGVQPPQR